MGALPRSTFGRRLRALRLTHGMSQVELAQRVGRHQTAIGPYERDEYEPPREVVEKLAAALDTTPEYLYFGRNPQQTALSPFPAIREHVLLPFAKELPQVKLEVTRAQLEAVVATVPDAWLTDEPGFSSAAEVRASYVAFFETRLANQTVFMEAAHRARSERV